jgi:hypothetical protein
MNTTAMLPTMTPARSPLPADAASAARDAGRGARASAAPHHQGQAFERLLRDKAAAQVDDAAEDGSDAELKDAPADPVAFVMKTPSPTGTPAVLLPPPVVLKAGAPEHNAAGGFDLALPGERASIAPAEADVAIGGNPMALALSPGQAEAGSAWQVTLNDPRGVAVELSALRPPAQAMAGTSAGWTLTIGSPVVDAAVLLRHAPRLNERLRARAMGETHVRIEDDEDRGH